MNISWLILIKKRLFLLLIFFSTCSGYAQNSNDATDIDTEFDKAFGFYLNNHDSLAFYLNKVKQLALRNSDIASLCTAYNVESWSSSYYGNLNLIKDNIISLDSIITIYKIEFDELSEKGYYLCQTNYTKGQYYKELKDYKVSKSYFDTIITYCENLPTENISEDLMSLYLESNIYIALMSNDENKYSIAKEYLEKNFRTIGDNQTYVGEFYNTKMHLANTYSQEKKYDEANAAILNSLPYYKTKKNKNRLITGYRRIIENQINNKQLDSSDHYLKLLKNEVFESSHFKHIYFNTEAKVYESSGNYENALVSLKSELELIKDKWKSSKHTEIAEIYLQIGILHSNFKSQKKAIYNYNLALNQFSEDSINSTINKTTKFKILKHKSTALNHLKNHTLTLETSNEAINILDSLKPSFQTNSDKLFLIENAFPLFENGIEAAFQLYKETENTDYIDTAFFYSEKSKSTLLLESLLAAQATTFANLPDDLIEKEKQLKAKITYLEKQIIKNSNNRLNDALFDVKQNHRNLVSSLENDYKDYYDLKYNTQVTTLNSLQKRLDDETVLVSYLYGNQTIYVITVTKKSKQIEAIIIDADFEAKLKNCYILLSNPKSDIKELRAQTNELYNKLLKSSISKSPKDHIIIVPDGLLNYLPFESLVDENLNYLIENHSIGYVNSATLLLQLQPQKQSNREVLAFAPSFKSNSTHLPIPNNTVEVEQVLSHFKGEKFVNNDASLQNFNNKNKDFGIIHLATHAILDDGHPEYSYLAFSDNTAETEHLLYVNDLYNLELNSNIVTLSACETGIGQLKKGEGMMSLARGFYFSGTSSIASTLWKVNDATSSNLMNDFYQELSEGKSKHKALQSAKINFLKKNKDNALSHPYYWSGFIISGNTDALVSNFNWIYVVLGILLLFIILYIFRRKKRMPSLL